MDNVPVKQLRYLGFHDLAENWQSIMKKATRYRPSYQKFLSELVETEYERKVEKARLARIKRAKIPEVLVMETFPFDKQPRLKKKLVLDLYDSLVFMHEHQDLIFIGPTGCGKTGLATAFLVHALNEGFRGLFVDFKDLLNTLHQSQGDYSEDRLMKRFAAYDVLLIDELGYIAGKKEQMPLFFDLMRRRQRGSTTIITTQLGFDEWGTFLHDPVGSKNSSDVGSMIESESGLFSIALRVDYVRPYRYSPGSILLASLVTESAHALEKTACEHHRLHRRGTSASQ